MSETGPFIVNSTWNVTSGTNTLDAPNYGSWTTFDITAVSTPAQIVQIFGDPVR